MNNALALRPSSPLEDLMRQNNRSRELLPKEPGWTYGSILPLAERGGKYSLAIPDIVRGPINDLWSLATQWPEPGQNLSPQAIGGVLFLAAPSVATKADESTLGLLAGPRAIDAPLYKLSVAKALTQGGHSPESVWSATGWGSQFAQPEGAAARWAWEIPDYESRLTFSGSVPTGISAPAASVLSHPQLFQHYPTLGQVPVHFTGEPGAWYDPAGDEIGIPARYSEKQFHSSLLHELQHAVQQREGWPSGGSPEQFQTPEWRQAKISAGSDVSRTAPSARAALSRVLDSANLPENHPLRFMAKVNTPMMHILDQSPPEIQDALMSDPAFRKYVDAQEAYSRIAQQPMVKYMSLTGEVEARLAQRRAAMMTQELRTKAPWNMFPIARGNQLVIPHSGPLYPP